MITSIYQPGRTDRGDGEESPADGPDDGMKAVPERIPPTGILSAKVSTTEQNTSHSQDRCGSRHFPDR